ncbi:MAG: peptidoglycan DD-metalloendopeptidase family protein [Psychromonas sp.]
MKQTNINKRSFNKNSFQIMLVNSILLLSLFSLPVNDAFAEKNLSTLQKQIKSSKSSQQLHTKQRKKLERQIATSEQETAVVSLKLQQTEEAIKIESQRFNDLIDETKQLKIDKIKQQQLLEQQLISAYMAGQNDLIKLLLNQENLSQIIRAKSYYYYLNKARLESIEKLQATQQRMEKNKNEQEASLLNLQAMRNEQIKNKSIFRQERTKRAKALHELKQDINYQSARLAQLNDAEKKLKKKLAQQKAARVKQELARAEAEAAKQELARAKSEAIKQITVTSEKKNNIKIAKLKGQLHWPIRGKVLARFGSQRSAQVRWKGISIAANEGEKVRAVATGRVLFAGYFKGYGMVIALDHNDDYITLYGYNQTLLQKTGDVVSQGDALALAGHSGGQDKNSLYFELSHKGKAQDPLSWLAPKRR